MALSALKQQLSRNLSNIPGWRTNRKILVIESDDWGSSRMPSKAVKELFVKRGLPVEKCWMSSVDSLECNADLEGLFNVLTSFKDKRGNHPVFTAVSMVANPDYEAIRANGFSEYMYEPFTKTLERYDAHDKVYDLWLKGKASNIFVPQFHGREHVNVKRWMRDLKAGNELTLFGFEHGFTGFTSSYAPALGEAYQAAFDIDKPEDVDYLESVLREGTHLFEQLLGYKASFFVPPNGPFNNKLEGPAADFGLKYMGTPKKQHEPLGNGEFAKNYRYLGKKNAHGQTYLTRNCFFEPGKPTQNWVNTCMSEIATSFRWGKPAVISTHRANYTGYIDPANLANGLKELEKLLKAIVVKWPDVEFMSSDALGDVITNKQHGS